MLIANKTRRRARKFTVTNELRAFKVVSTGKHLRTSQINWNIYWLLHKKCQWLLYFNYNRYFYSVFIYLALREFERCACFKSTNTAAGVIPSILLAAPCDSKDQILISSKLIAAEIKFCDLPVFQA